jgi:hypothetical protein
MWHTLYMNVFFFLKHNHVVDEVDIDEECQKWADNSKFHQKKDGYWCVMPLAHLAWNLSRWLMWLALEGVQFAESRSLSDDSSHQRRQISTTDEVRKPGITFPGQRRNPRRTTKKDYYFLNQSSSYSLERPPPQRDLNRHSPISDPPPPDISMAQKNLRLSTSKVASS